MPFLLIDFAIKTVWDWKLVFWKQFAMANGRMGKYDKNGQVNLGLDKILNLSKELNEIISGV